MIKKILRSRRLVYLEKKGYMKVDKRDDGLIEIRDMNTGKKYAIFKRISLRGRFGRLYLGFDRHKPFVVFFSL